MIHRHGFHGQISIVPELSITDVFVIFGKQQPTEKEFMRSLHDANFFEWLEHRIQQFMQFADLGSKHGHKFILQCELKKLHRRRRLRRMAKMGSNHNVKIQKQSEEGL